MTPELKRRIQLAWYSFRRYSRVLYDRSVVPLNLKARMIKAEVLEALLYGCATWSLQQTQYAKLLSAHHRFLLRCIGKYKEKRTDHVIAYEDCLERTGCESVETTIRRRRLLFAGRAERMDAARLPKLMMMGRLKGERGTSNEKNWWQCLKDDLVAFGIAPDKKDNSWIERAKEPSDWHQTVEEGAEKFMATWKIKVDAVREARHKREAEKREEDEQKEASDMTSCGSEDEGEER